MRVGMWLSLVERLVRDQEVAGSNPVIPTIIYLKHHKTAKQRETPLFLFCPLS